MAFEMAEPGPLEPPTSKCNVLMSKAQNIGLWGEDCQSPTFLHSLLSFLHGLWIYLLSSSFSPPFFGLLLPAGAPVSSALVTYWDGNLQAKKAHCPSQYVGVGEYVG